MKINGQICETSGSCKVKLMAKKVKWNKKA